VNTIVSIPDTHEHRLCVKHLYGNFKKRHPGENLKEAMWKAVRCTAMVEFNKAMENLKNINEVDWKEMSEHVVGTWSRAGFSAYTCCDLQVNNMCEAFNSAIVDIREHAVISLVDGLKRYMIDRIVKLRDYMLRYDGQICPMINKLLDKSKKEAEGWFPNWSGDRGYARFTVYNGTYSYVVNLGENSCAYGKWDLSDISYPHAIACIWYNQKNPNDYVAHWYRLVHSLPSFYFILVYKTH